MTEQLTKEQAIKIYESGIWKDMDFEQIVKFQLFQDRLCMPFSNFHEAVENVLGRPVYTHEFADRDSLVAEYLKQKPAPTFDEIIGIIPAEKLIAINIRQ